MSPELRDEEIMGKTCHASCCSGETDLDTLPAEERAVHEQRFAAEREGRDWRQEEAMSNDDDGCTYCGECVYWERGAKDSLLGKCHRYAPRPAHYVFAEDEEKSPYIEWNFPETSDEDFCGEARRR